MSIFSKVKGGEDVVVGRATVLQGNGLPAYYAPSGMCGVKTYPSGLAQSWGDNLLWASGLNSRYLVGPSGSASWEMQ